MTPIEAMALAVEKSGGQAALGKAVGRPQQTISDWCRTGRPAPSVVLSMAAVAGVDPHWFRPDVFPAPAKEGEAA